MAAKRVTVEYLMPFIKSSVDKLQNKWKPNLGAWDATVKITLTSLFKHLYIMILSYPEYVIYKKKFRESLYTKAESILSKDELRDQKVYKYAKLMKEACDNLILWEKHLGIYGKLKIAGVRELIAQKISIWTYPREVVYYIREGMYFRLTENNVRILI